MSAKKPETEKVGSVTPFGLRMLPALREQIFAIAEANGRSMNAEIVHRLEVSIFQDNVATHNRDETIETRIFKLSNELSYLATLLHDRQTAKEMGADMSRYMDSEKRHLRKRTADTEKREGEKNK